MAILLPLIKEHYIFAFWLSVVALFCVKCIVNQFLKIFHRPPVQHIYQINGVTITDLDEEADRQLEVLTASVEGARQTLEEERRAIRNSAPVVSRFNRILSDD